MLGNTIKRYLAELRTREVWMYHQTRPDYAGDWPAMVKVAELAGRGRPRSTSWPHEGSAQIKCLK